MMFKAHNKQSNHRILFTMHSYAPNEGGVTSCSIHLLRRLANIGVNVRLLAIVLRGSGTVPELDFSADLLQDDTMTAFGISRNYRLAMDRLGDCDLIHVNGMWLYTNYYSCKLACERNIPYVISPHGMLYPQAFRHGRLKKLIFLKILFERYLQRATCLHATCEEEIRVLRNLGLKNPIALIPNSVEVSDDSVVILQKNKDLTSPRIGYLGRLHPRKHIEILIRVLADLESEIPGLQLHVVGEGSQRYVAELKRLASSLGVSGEIVWHGGVYGKHKYEIIRELSLLCVPSDFENFGMVVPEALLMETPVIASRNTPWSDLEKYDCGRWMNATPKDFCAGVRSLLSASPEELLRMGQRGRQMVIQKYNVNEVAAKFKLLYEWLIDGGATPDFVDL